MGVPPGLGECVLHRAGRSISHPGQDVGVGVEGESYIGMPKKLLHDLGVNAPTE
jgi:hypothetical protein